MCRAQQSSPISIIQYNQQCLEKTSVDAHGLSSCLGCSRILWHLISFEDHHRDSNITHHVTSHHVVPHNHRLWSKLANCCNVHKALDEMQRSALNDPECSFNQCMRTMPNMHKCRSERWGMQNRSLQEVSEKGCWISADHHCYLKPYTCLHWNNMK